MICELRNNAKEIVLRNPSISDVLALASLLIFHDREIVFTKPMEVDDGKLYD